MNKKSIKLALSAAEKKALRSGKMRIADLYDHTAEELCSALGVTKARAKELRAMVEFQTVPSIGIRFAEDLISMGYHSLDELRGKDGARLTEEFEQLKGYWIDPCVEDQFRLAVHYAAHRDNSKNWWDFTNERKAYRLKNGYPKDRPSRSWVEAVGIKTKSK